MLNHLAIIRSFRVSLLQLFLLKKYLEYKRLIEIK